MEGLRFDFACKLISAPARFVDAGRRHETPGSETKGFITHSTASSMRVVFPSVPFAPEFHGNTAKGSSWMQHHLELSQLRKPQSYKGAAGKPAHPLPQRETLSLFYWLGSNSDPEGDTVSIFQGYLLYRYP